MFDEENYKELSKYVYRVDKYSKSYDADLKEGLILEGENPNYFVPVPRLARIISSIYIEPQSRYHALRSHLVL